MPVIRKLSVAIITFNQRSFVAEALDSVLMQRTKFEYEIIIGDDCSTDGTADVIREYQRKYPAKILPIFEENNIGMGRNFAKTLNRCSGEYVALLEGDDYWTDPEKLQQQAAFLDANPGCAFCHHRVNHIVSPGGKYVRDFPPQQFRATRLDTRRLAMANFVQTCSVVYRKEWQPVLDEGFQELKLGDWPLCSLLGERGWIGYLDRPMANYRIHANNTWNDRPPDYKLRGMEKMGRYLLGKVGGKSRDAWSDFLLAVAFKDFALSLKLSPAKSIEKLRHFAARSLEFKKPFWIFNRLWPYYRANRSNN
jgi:glycosyltransferase involved in cell wall biosynthesis